MASNGGNGGIVEAKSTGGVLLRSRKSLFEMPSSTASALPSPLLATSQSTVRRSARLSLSTPHITTPTPTVANTGTLKPSLTRNAKDIDLNLHQEVTPAAPTTGIPMIRRSARLSISKPLHETPPEPASEKRGKIPRRMSISRAARESPAPSSAEPVPSTVATPASLPEEKAEALKIKKVDVYETKPIEKCVGNEDERENVAPNARKRRISLLEVQNKINAVVGMLESNEESGEGHVKEGKQQPQPLQRRKSMRISLLTEENHNPVWIDI